MPRKKRDNRKNRAREYDFRAPSEESTKGKEIIDETLVKGGAIKGAKYDDFSEAGYMCDHGDWSTPKKGNSGIQALRAHSKIHVRDRRAVVNTLIVQAAALVIAIMIALSPLLTGLATSDEIGKTRPYAPIDTKLLFAGTATASVLITTAILFTGYWYSVTGKRRWWSRYKWAVRVLVALMWSVAGTGWSNAEHGLSSLWMIPVLAPWGSWFLIGYDVALTRLAVRRHKFKPRNQRKLLKSKSKITDQRVSIFRRSVERGIRNGQIVLDKLSSTQREFFDRLGLANTRLDKRAQQRRLEWEEEKRLKIEQRDLRHRRDQVAHRRWGAGPNTGKRG
ncbi:hypothetical protein [Candidatus Lucifugimonas marina]|uniref:hypothetical protein n=1 Tax=Candidatus Lucifugimonas marina TaxID=3038979 RepID=UPI00319E4B3C